MEIHFVQPDLRRLDALKCEALVIPFFSDERPLRGAAGLVDWRLCGRLSKLLVNGRLRGERGDKVLLPAAPRLPFDKLFLFGTGERAAFDETTLRETMTVMFETLERARVRASVLSMPGRALGLVDSVKAMEIFLELGDVHTEQDDVTLIEDLDSQRAMVPIVERHRRKRRAEE
jgi:hypothetical protein